MLKKSDHCKITYAGKNRNGSNFLAQALLCIQRVTVVQCANHLCTSILLSTLCSPSPTFTSPSSFTFTAAEVHTIYIANLKGQYFHYAPPTPLPVATLSLTCTAPTNIYANYAARCKSAANAHCAIHGTCGAARSLRSSRRRWMVCYCT